MVGVETHEPTPIAWIYKNEVDYENVAWFLKKYKKYHYVKETPYSVTFATEPDKNGKVEIVEVMESYFLQFKDK